MNEECDPIELSVPLRKEYARMVRLVVASVAQLCGFDIDRIDDVKLAAGEAFLLAVALGQPGELLGIRVADTKDGLSLVLAGIGLSHWDTDESLDARCWRYGLFVLGSIADKAELVSRDGRTDLEVLIGHSGGP